MALEKENVAMEGHAHVAKQFITAISYSLPEYCTVQGNSPPMNVFLVIQHSMNT